MYTLTGLTAALPSPCAEAEHKCNMLSFSDSKLKTLLPSLPFCLNDFIFPMPPYLAVLPITPVLPMRTPCMTATSPPKAAPLSLTPVVCWSAALMALTNPRFPQARHFPRGHLPLTKKPVLPSPVLSLRGVGRLHQCSPAPRQRSLLMGFSAHTCVCHTGGHKAHNPVCKTVPVAFAKTLCCILAGAKEPLVLETALGDSLAESAGCWLSLPGAAGVSLGSKEETHIEVGSPATELYCKLGGLTHAVWQVLQGDHPGTSSLVSWPVSPLRHHGAGGAAW